MNTQLLFLLQSFFWDSNFLFGMIISAAVGAVVTYFILKNKNKEPEIPTHKNTGTVSQLVAFNQDCKEYFDKL